jgi:hypothetical protein
MSEEIKRLNRYTNLPVLLDLLEAKRLVLLDPSLSWDDKNDTLIIEAYKEKAKIKNLFALCFTHEQRQFIIGTHLPMDQVVAVFSLMQSNFLKSSIRYLK